MKGDPGMHNHQENRQVGCIYTKRLRKRPGINQSWDTILAFYKRPTYHDAKWKKKYLHGTYSLPHLAFPKKLWQTFNVGISVILENKPPIAWILRKSCIKLMSCYYQLRIQFKLNTALLSHCPSVRVFVTGVTSHIYRIYKGINAMLIIRGPIKPYIFWIKIILAIFLAKTRPDKTNFSALTNLTIDIDFELSKI